jgi:hypothetical protein
MGEYKPIWESKKWSLMLNDNDEFVIYNNITTEEIEIMKEDKQEFQQLISVLANELWQESTDFRKNK